jgi:hypothetical protein
MHDIEPFYNWRHIYIADEDKKSPFYRRTYYLKIIYVDYELNFAIIELIGEWNDAIENDIMQLKRDVIDQLFQEKIFKYILITENVLNFHSSDKEYYEEWFEQVTDEEGWIVALNMPEATQYDFKRKKLNYFIELMQLENWRVYKPYHLFRKIDDELSKRIQ